MIAAACRHRAHHLDRCSTCGLVFERTTGASPLILGAIAIVATLNGIVVQMIMASRVIYGLASQGSLPATLASVSAVTGTPLIATALAVLAVLVLAVAFPLEGLAEWTSRLTLAVFLLVNAALVALKLRGEPAPLGGMAIPIAVPIAGKISTATAGLNFGDLITVNRTQGDSEPAPPKDCSAEVGRAGTPAPIAPAPASGEHDEGHDSDNAERRVL